MLAVVPARGGSKGIRGKNLRLLHGKPLLVHTLDLLEHVPHITQIVVSTENAEIASVARLHGHRVIERPETLARDDVPVGPVIVHAATQAKWQGPVVTVQPTCPTISGGELSVACHAFLENEWDSLGFVQPFPHLLWDDDGPLYGDRVNRQEQAGHYVELGVFISRRVPVSDTSPLVGANHHRHVVSGHADIDTVDDLDAARRRLGRRHVEFRVACTRDLGSGHLFRALQLADELAHHDVTFAYQPAWPSWATTKIEGFHPVARDADLVIFDKLDTTVQEVAHVKASGALAVTLEDLGSGARLADLTVNELYVSDVGVSGPRWAVIRPEFCGLPPFRVVERGRRVLVAFGGTDPAGLTARFAPLVAREAQCFALYGPGADPADIPLVERVEGPVAELMRSVDLVVCSAGRMAHEAAAVGVPCVTVAANERESRHSHCPGIVRFGLHSVTSNDQVQDAVGSTLRNPELRSEMSVTARAAVDGLGGRRIARRVDDLLEGL